MTIPEHVKKILEALNREGFEGYAVGGCVRDAVLNRVPEDWDITTDATPEEVKRIFGRTLDTGIAHGTVTVMLGKEGYEVTTYRTDGEYSDGRHPDYVTFTPSLKEDLKRRDFTINAMACGLDEQVIDLFGGREDLLRRVIRCVGAPAERFHEDALRMLRAIRFSAQLNFDIEPETWRALCGQAENMRKVSRERIFSELNKILLSEHPGKLALLISSGMGKYLDISAEELLCSEEIAALPKQKHLRWAALCSNLSGEGAGAVLHSLKSELETERRVLLLVREMKEKLPENLPQMRRKLAAIGPDRMEDLIILKQFGFGSKSSEQEVFCARQRREAVLEAGDCISRRTLTVSGKDLLKAGVRPGPPIGEALDYLFQLVLNEPELNEKNVLLQRLEEKRRREKG